MNPHSLNVSLCVRGIYVQSELRALPRGRRDRGGRLSVAIIDQIKFKEVWVTCGCPLPVGNAVIPEVSFRNYGSQKKIYI